MERSKFTRSSVPDITSVIRSSISPSLAGVRKTRRPDSGGTGVPGRHSNRNR